MAKQGWKKAEGLTKRQEDTMKRHSEHHTKKHGHDAVTDDRGDTFGHSQEGHEKGRQVMAKRKVGKKKPIPTDKALYSRVKAGQEEVRCLSICRCQRFGANLQEAWRKVPDGHELS